MLNTLKNFFAQFSDQSQPAQRVYWFTLVLLLGFLGTLLLSGYHLLQASPYYPYIYFLFDPQFLHSDFIEMYWIFEDGLQNIYRLGGGENYLPIGFILFYPFSFLPQQIAPYALEILFVGSILWLIYKWLPSVKYNWLFALLITFLSFPVLFVLNRGNLEMILFLLMMLFIVCYKKGKFYWAGFFLACAIDFKIYPAVFLALFISDRRFKAFFATLLFAGILLVGGFYITGGSISSLLMGFHTYSGGLFTSHTLEFSHSLLNLIRVPVFFLLPHSPESDWDIFIQFGTSVSHYYMVLMFLFFGAICARITFVTKMPLWQKVFLLALAQCSFPFVAPAYFLLILILPLLLFFQEEKNIPNSTLIACSSALAFIPMNWILFFFATPVEGHLVINIGCLLRPLVLLYLTTLIFFLPVKKDLPYTHK